MKVLKRVPLVFVLVADAATLVPVYMVLSYRYEKDVVVVV
jgi:hypothetical protein